MDKVSANIGLYYAEEDAEGNRDIRRRTQGGKCEVEGPPFGQPAGSEAMSNCAKPKHGRFFLRGVQRSWRLGWGSSKTLTNFFERA